MTYRFILFFLGVSCPIVSVESQVANPSFMMYESSQGDARIFSNIYFHPGRETDVIFHTSFIDCMLAVNSQFNAGVRLRYRTVRRESNLNITDAFSYNHKLLDSAYHYQRHGLTGAELLFRHPLNIRNLDVTVQHALGFPIGNQLQNHIDEGFLDWDGLSVQSQFFSNLYFRRIWIFLDMGYRIDNLQRSLFEKSKPYYFEVSLPVGILPGVFLNRRHYFFILSQYIPSGRFSRNWYNGLLGTSMEIAHSFQIGTGYKLFVTRNFELELIFSGFLSNQSTAFTYNLGFRKYFNRSLY